MYSTVTGSSTVSRWLWHSTRARLMTILASAVRPETRAEAVRATRHYTRVQGWHTGTCRLSKKQGDAQLGIELPCTSFCSRELRLPKLALLKVVTHHPWLRQGGSTITQQLFAISQSPCVTTAWPHQLVTRAPPTTPVQPVPAKAMQTLSSKAQIFRTVLSSCSLATDFFSTPRTTMSLPRTPT